MSKTTNRVERSVHLRWVPIDKMRVSSRAQRDQSKGRIDAIAAGFDIEQIGTPTVNERDGIFWIIDGAHRIGAMKQIGWGDQQVQCWCYDGLTEEEEAETFLKLNDVKPVSAMHRFKVGVVANRDIESDIDRVVRSLGLNVSAGGGVGSIGAVGSLHKAYKKVGPDALAQTLRIIRDAYGDPGFKASVIDGISLVVGKYGDELDEERAIVKLSSANGGLSALTGKAAVIRKSTGEPVTQCTAAAAVEIYNTGRGGQKIPGWWRVEAAS